MVHPLNFRGNPARKRRPRNPNREGATWKLSLGPLEISEKDIEVKPQFKVALKNEHYESGWGIDDVRDGLKVFGGVSVTVAGKSHGTTVEELCENVSFDSSIPAKFVKDFADAVLKFLLQGILHHPVNVVLKKMGLDIVQAISSGKMMTMKLQYSTGVGFTVGVKLGWCDTTGYHMVGGELGASALASVAGTVYAGVSHDKKNLKIQLAAVGVSSDIVIPLP